MKRAGEEEWEGESCGREQVGGLKGWRMGGYCYMMTSVTISL